MQTPVESWSVVQGMTRCLFFAVVLILSDAELHAATEYFNLSGTPAPDGNGTFSGMAPPSLNDEGQLAFTASLIGTTGGNISADRFGVFRIESAEPVTQIARGLQTAAGGAEVFGQTYTSPPPINSDGELAFGVTRNGFSTAAGVYRGPTLTKIAERLESTPNGNGTYNGPSLSDFNSAGQLVFNSSLSGTSPGNANNAIFRGDGNTTVEIARIQSAPPEGNGLFSGFFTPALNESGQVAFSAQLNVGASPTGVYRGSGGSLTTIARQGQPAPALGGGSNGTFGTMAGFSAINDSGQVLFNAGLSGTSGGADDNAGVFLGDGTTTTLMLGKGQPAPDRFGGTTGNLFSFDPPTMNNSGTVIVAAGLSNTPGGFSDNKGIYISDGTTITEIARQGDPAPDGNGFIQLTNVTTRTMINEAGQAVFYCTHTGALPGTSFGIYLYDPEEGLVTVARSSPTITALELAGRGAGSNSNTMESSGLNNLGQVAYNFTTLTGVQGLALWTPDFDNEPETPGDYDGDGDVDGRDFLAWQRGESLDPFSPADLATWQAEYNGGLLTATTAVPEPSSLLLLTAGLLLISGRFSPLP